MCCCVCLSRINTVDTVRRRRRTSQVLCMTVHWCCLLLSASSSYVNAHQTLVLLTIHTQLTNTHHSDITFTWLHTYLVFIQQGCITLIKSTINIFCNVFKRFQFQINAVLFTFYSSKILKKKKLFSTSAANHQLEWFSEGSCDTENWK